jgi:hypothetical protein
MSKGSISKRKNPTPQRRHKEKRKKKKKIIRNNENKSSISTFILGPISTTKNFHARISVWTGQGE